LVSVQELRRPMCGVSRWSASRPDEAGQVGVDGVGLGVGEVAAQDRVLVSGEVEQAQLCWFGSEAPISTTVPLGATLATAALI